MKLLKVISIVLCILTSSLSKAEEFNLIDEVLSETASSDITTKFIDKGLGGVLNQYHRKVYFGNCKRLKLFDDSPEDLALTEDALKKFSGIPAITLMGYGVYNNLITIEDMELLKAHYIYVEDEIYRRYQRIKRDRNSSKDFTKYEDELRSICQDFDLDLFFKELKQRKILSKYYLYNTDNP